MDRLNNGQHTTNNTPLGMGQVDTFMQQALAENVFPGAVLLVSKFGDIEFHRAYGFSNILSRRTVTTETIFDLASLTKPLATALAVMILIQQKRVGLEQNLGDILPAFKDDKKSSIKIKHLLYHNSGLLDYRPYYKNLAHLPAGERKNELRKLLLNELPVHSVGAKVVYSDLGFMILEWLVEQISGNRLDRFVSEMIYDPLKLKNLFFVDLNAAPPPDLFAATEQCPWRQKVISGQVHDENAFVVGGIQGHAGLFGTAADVHSLLRELLNAYHGDPPSELLHSNLVRLFLRRLPDTDKALGFDMPAAKDSSSGNYFSRNSVGHLGFTGTSFWMDLDRSIIIILLTNRVHPSRENMAIKDFRPKLHNMLMKCLLGIDRQKE